MQPKLSFSLVLGLLVAGVAFACSDSKDDQATNTTPPGQNPEELFRAIQADLVKTCGGANGACHVEGKYVNPQGSPAALWLGPGDPYTVAKAYPGIVPITNEPRDSKLLTQVEHDGPALVSQPDLFEGVRKWVAAEVANSSGHPVTEAFYLKDGANSVSLAGLAAGAEGSSLTFNAQNLDGTVFISDMKVTAGAKGLRMKNATFVILPASGPTRIDSVSGFGGELLVKAGETLPFYTGESILQKWNALNRLKIVFDQFSTSDAIADASVPGCKALDLFVANAVPALKLDLGGQTCFSCHGAVNPEPGSLQDVAVLTLDLRELDTNPASACAQALTHVNLTDKPNSNIIKSATGGPNMTHPSRYVCGTDAGEQAPDAAPLEYCTPASFEASMLTWINAE
jgi:hypothetical protein